MPVKVKEVDGFQVSHGGKVSAKGTSFQKAQAQAALLRGVEHGWEPTGAKGKRTYKKHHSAELGSFIEKRSKL